MDDASEDVANDRLPAILMGEGPEEPAVFLHGFAGSALSWRAVQPEIARDRPTLAFDLPGHAGAKNFPGFGPAKVAARAVIAELDRRGIESAHLVGHSMGGAIAALMALFSADRIASLTLLAPGGFGPEIGTAPLRSIVEGDGPALETGWRAMGAPDWQPPADVLSLYEEIRASQSPTALAAIFALLFRNELQGVLPLDAVAAMGMPVRVVWGDEDRVTPFSQSGFMPPSFRLKVLPGIGHMLMDEAPDATVAAIRDALRGENGPPH